MYNYEFRCVMVTKSYFLAGQINTQHSISTIPFDRDKGFVGREEILTAIDRRLLVESRVAIAGIGGVGSEPSISVLFAHTTDIS